LDGFFSSFPLDDDEDEEEEEEEEEEEDLAGGGAGAEVASAAMWFHIRAKLVESAAVSWGRNCMYSYCIRGQEDGMRSDLQQTSDSQVNIGQVQPGYAGQDAQHLYTCRSVG
jgi:hypothetical protein